MLRDYDDEEDFKEATAMKLMSFTCKDQLFRDAYTALCSQMLSNLMMYLMMPSYDPDLLVPTAYQIAVVNALLDDAEPLATEINGDISQLYLDRVALTDSFLTLWSMLWQCVDVANQ